MQFSVWYGAMVGVLQFNIWCGVDGFGVGVWCGAEWAFVVMLLVVFGNTVRVEEGGGAKSMETMRPTAPTHFILLNQPNLI